MGRSRANTISAPRKGSSSPAAEEISLKKYSRSSTQPAMETHHYPEEVDSELFVSCRPGKEPVEITGYRMILGGNGWLTKSIIRAMKHPGYSVFVCVLFTWSVVYVFDRNLLIDRISPPVLSVLPLLPLFCVTLLELANIDRSVLGALTFFTHSWWYLMLQILTHAASTVYHYLYGRKHRDVSEDHRIAYTSVPFFVLIYSLLVSSDAVVYRHITIKRLMLFLGVANLIRLLITDTWGWDVHRHETEEHDFCTLFCVSVLKLRYGTVIIMLIYMMRMLYQSIVRPENALLLRVPVKFSLGVGHSHAEAHESYKGTRAVRYLRPGYKYTMCHNEEISSLRLRASYKDMVLNLPWFAALGRTRGYVGFLALYICCAWSLMVSTIAVEWYVAILMNIPLMFIIVVELSSRMNRHLLLLVVQRFEWQYLACIVMVWSSQIVMRNSLQSQDYDTNISLYYTTPHVAIPLLVVISFDSYVSPKGITIKKVCLVMLMLLIPTWMLYARFGGGGKTYFWCHIWCTDSYTIDGTAQFNLFLFVVKYVFRILREPDRFLILNDHLNFLPSSLERLKTARTSIHHVIVPSSASN